MIELLLFLFAVIIFIFIVIRHEDSIVRNGTVKISTLKEGTRYYLSYDKDSKIVITTDSSLAKRWKIQSSFDGKKFYIKACDGGYLNAYTPNKYFMDLRSELDDYVSINSDTWFKIDKRLDSYYIKNSGEKYIYISNNRSLNVISDKSGLEPLNFEYIDEKNFEEMTILTSSDPEDKMYSTRYHLLCPNGKKIVDLSYSTQGSDNFLITQEDNSFNIQLLREDKNKHEVEINISYRLADE